MRLVRSDFDSDEGIGSRCLGAAAITPRAERDAGEAGSEAAAEGDGTVVDAAVELAAPLRPGAYRLFFRLVVGVGERMLPVAECDELFADFVVDSGCSGTLGASTCRDRCIQPETAPSQQLLS